IWFLIVVVVSVGGMRENEEQLVLPVNVPALMTLETALETLGKSKLIFSSCE
ncbi:unnamed protein product, partial [Allacma fusca]